MTLLWYGLFGVFACASVATAWRVGAELLRAPWELFRGPARDGLDGGLWFAAALFGAAGVIQIADAVAVGGPGVLPWLWLCALLSAPLFYAEAILARVAPAGTADGEAPGSFAGYIRRASPSQGAGLALTVLRALAALGVPCLAIGALFNVVSAAPHPSPFPVPAVWLVAMLVLFSVASTALADRIPFGAVSAVGVLILTAPFAGAVASHLATVPSVLLRGVSEATSTGSTDAVPALALSHVLPLFVAWVGISSAVRRRPQGSVAKEAALAASAPLILGVLLTVVGVGVAASASANQPIQSKEALSDVTARRTVDGGDDGATKPYTGYERFIDGRMRSPGLRLFTERGPIVEPVLCDLGAKGVEPGTPADVAIQFKDGTPFRMLEARAGALTEAPPGALRNLWVRGGVLPRRSQLLFEEIGATPLATWAVLGAIMLTGLAAMARWASAMKDQPHGIAIVVGQLVVLVLVFGGDPWEHREVVVLSFFLLTIAPLLALARYARPRL